MKASLLYDLQSQGFKVYPRGEKYLVFHKSFNWGLYSVRELARLARMRFDKDNSKFKKAQRRQDRRTERQKVNKEINKDLAG
jgi:hypothetical protein